MIVAARANKLDAIDGPYANFNNPDGYRREASWSATLGGVGKWCIHPNQIPIANEVFAPTRVEMENARENRQCSPEGRGRRLGAANLDGNMVDAATTRVYEVFLERARICAQAG